MKISVDEARAYFDHPTQRKGCMIDPADLPGEPFQYWALDGVCGVFHPDHWPGVWMGHYGVKPEAWGQAVHPAKRILRAFCEAERPDLIIGWTAAENRAANAFVRRLGFRETGRMTTRNGVVVMTEFRTWQ